MRISSIGQDNYTSFAPLLLQEVRDMVQAKEEVLLLGLVEEDKAIGAIAATFDAFDLRILSIYVEENARRRGGGTMLLDALVSLAGEYIVGIVADFAAAEQGTLELKEFLTASGFTRSIGAGKGLYKIELADILRSDSYRENTDFGRTFSELSEHELVKLKKYAVVMGGFVPEDGLDAPTVDRSLSVASFDGTEANGYIVVERVSEKAFSITSIQNDGDKSNAPLLMKRAITECKNKYGEDVVFFVEPVHDKILGFVQLIPEAENVACSMYKVV